MRIDLRLFAVVRERAGVDRIELNLPEGATVADACEEIGRQHSALAPLLPRVAWAVNRDYASLETSLKAGDELAIIPPVSGG